MTTQSLRKIYLSLYLKGFVWEGVGDRTELQHINPPLLWPSALCLSRSPGLLNRRPGDPAFCWVLAFSTTSLQLLVSKTNWLPVFTELYNSSIAHSIFLEWHVWSSSSGNNCHVVHRSLSVGASVYDCTMGFYLVPYCQPSPPPYAISSHNCHRNVSLPSGASLWNGMFGRVDGQYTTGMS